MKVIDLKNVKFASINHKYGYDPKKKRLYLANEYRDMKKLLTYSCKKIKIDPPYVVSICIDSYLDIDNMIKVVLDSLSLAGVIDNDKNVLSLIVEKHPIKKGATGNISVYVESV